MEVLFRRFIIGLLMLAVLFVGCNDDDETQPARETGTMTDVEGNVYKTVKIGNQWWMAENLRVKKFRNGMSIPNITDSAGWAFRTTSAYCVYDNGNTQSPAPGLLYNWETLIDSSNLAPEGWHIPTDAEWKTLELELGMDGSEADKSGWRGTNEANKLRVESPDSWTLYEDVWSDNESGFSAMAGGCRLPNSNFAQPGLFSTGFWWTRSESQLNEAWYRYLDYKSTRVFRSHDSKSYGFSVRCVKD